VGAWLLPRAIPPRGHYNIIMVKLNSNIVIFDPIFTWVKLTILKMCEFITKTIAIQDDIFFSIETKY